MNGDIDRARCRGAAPSAAGCRKPYSPKLPHQVRPPYDGDRLGHDRELAVAPVEAARLDHDAADRRAVAAEELGGRVHDDVGAPLASAGTDRAWPPWRRRPAARRRRGPRRRARRGRRRRPTGWRPPRRRSPGRRASAAAIGVGLAGRDERRLDAEAPQRHVEQRPRAAVELGRRRRCGRRHRTSAANTRNSAAWPLAVADRADAALEAGHALLEGGDRRVRDAAVDRRRTSAARRDRRRRRCLRRRSWWSGRSAPPGRRCRVGPRRRRAPRGCGTRNAGRRPRRRPVLARCDHDRSCCRETGAATTSDARTQGAISPSRGARNPYRTTWRTDGCATKSGWPWNWWGDGRNPPVK